MLSPSTYKLTLDDYPFYVSTTCNELTEELKRHCKLAHEGNHEKLYRYMRNAGIKNIEIDNIDEDELQEFRIINGLHVGLINTKNIKFRYTIGEKCYEFEIKTDHYTYGSLYRAIRGYLDEKGYILMEIDPDNRCVVVVPKDCTVDFTVDDRLNTILGFDKTVLTEGVYFGKRPISLVVY